MTPATTPRQDARWPRPPFAAPRGPREMLWHLVVGASLLPGLTSAIGLLALLSCGSTAWLLQTRPRRMSDIGLLYLLLALSYFLGRGDLDELPRYLALLVLPLQDATPVGFGGFLLHMSWAAATTALLQRFDTRAVNAAVVDDRVARRQQERRAQVLRTEHAGSSIPLLVP